MQIRKLLYEDGFTIAGAREKLRGELRLNRSQNQAANQVVSTASTPARGEALHGASMESQGALAFPAPLNGVRGKEELRRLRQQLREVLDLLS
jgi:hypothetical protein